MTALGSTRSVPRGCWLADSPREEERPKGASQLTGVPNLQARIQQLETIREFRLATNTVSLEDQVILKETASLSSDPA
jgi:hypothetical protein